MACATDSKPDRESEHTRYSTIVNVRNIDEQMTDETLKELFAPYGTLTSYKVMTSKNVEAGPFGYVAFEDPNAAEDAIIELNGQELATGRRLALRRTHEKIVRRVAPASPKIPRLTATTRKEIIVKYLDINIDEELLNDLFSSCGDITWSRIVRDQGISKGYGFVNFKTPQQAVRAVEKMNGKIVRGRVLFVDIARGADYSKNTREPQVKMTELRRTNRSNAESSSDASVREREPAEELRDPPPTPLPVSSRNEPVSSFARDFYSTSFYDSDDGEQW